MKKIKNIIGYLLMVFGTLCGLYVSIWTMFISPIIECCKAFDAGTLTGLIIGSTILKCVFSGTIGYVIIYVGCKIGTGLVD